jgi:hypothetical protein
MYQTLKDSKNHYFITNKVNRESSEWGNIYHDLKNSKNGGKKIRSDKEESIVSCNCKNSKCMKLYCECFASQSLCDPAKCSCKDCNNTSLNEVKNFFFNINFIKNSI